MRGGRVRVDGQQQHRAGLDVARVHAGSGADDAEPVLHDPGHAPAGLLAHRDDADGLVGDRLLAVLGDDLAALGLRHDLARHDDDVAGLERADRGDDDRGQVVAGMDLGHAGGRPAAQLGVAHRCSFGRTSRENTSIHSRWFRPTLWR